MDGPQLFESMYTDDPEANKLSALPGMEDLLSEYPFLSISSFVGGVGGRRLLTSFTLTLLQTKYLLISLSYDKLINRNCDPIPDYYIVALIIMFYPDKHFWSWCRLIYISFSIYKQTFKLCTTLVFTKVLDRAFVNYPVGFLGGRYQLSRIWNNLLRHMRKTHDLNTNQRKPTG